MKKIIGIILAAAMLLSFAACGGSSKPGTSTTPYVPAASDQNTTESTEKETEDPGNIPDDVAGGNDVMPDTFLPVDRDENVVYLLVRTEVESSGRHSTVLYEYDSNGRLLIESSGSYLGEEHMSTPDAEYQYTDEGFQMKLWEIGTVTANPEKISYQNHSFDAAGNLVYYEMYRASGQMLYYFEIEYDSQGRRIALDRYTVKDYLSAAFRYVYDEYDNLISYRDEYDPQVMTEYQYNHDSDGNLLSIYKKRFGDTSEKLIQSNTYESKHGLLISREDPRTGKITTYEYNGYGQCDKISFSDSNLVCEFQYDSAGNIIQKSVYDGSQLTARYTYEYITINRGSFMGLEKDYVLQIVFENSELESWTGSLY